MQTECSADLFGFAPVEGRRVEAAFDAGLATPDAGALLLGATDKAIGLIDRFAACFDDVRRQELIDHEVATLVVNRPVSGLEGRRLRNFDAFDIALNHAQARPTAAAE